ncbi:hypothetical protein SH1V18_03880 [Vallitalea longa]|uniref:Uncharacterized protein n=1 Tax=Vallitalea longa TaxID=2936439 RepID=A0A9W5Y8V1_9FIRM|nr:hypothetical protein [Vallitalea longa]GKX27908.1 hypothetical protein SH1V18_03880 [Vallitalea longa]
MDEIFMNVQDLELENNKIKQIPFRIDNIIRSYNNIINSLNKEIRYKAGINYDVISISKKLDNCEYNSEQLHLVLTDAIDQYQKTEIEIQKLLKNFQDTTFNNMSGVNNKIKTNIEDI